MMSHVGQIINNPESSSEFVPYAIYNTHKVARKQIQMQRQQTQLTVAYLERQAKKSLKSLQQKQKSLINYYKMKESQNQEFRKKEEHRKKMERELNQQKQMNNRLKQTNKLKIDNVKRQWQSLNKKVASDVKSFRSESERKLTEEKQLQRSLLKRRNEVFSHVIALGNEHSRVKSLYNKKYISSQVKNDLINVQDSIKKREIEKISTLSSRQQQLLDIVEKTRRDFHQYDATLNEFKTLPFDQLNHKIRSVRGKSTMSRRGSHCSDTLLI